MLSVPDDICREYILRVTTSGTHPEQLARLDRLVAREAHFAFGSSVDVFVVEGLWDGAPILSLDLTNVAYDPKEPR